MPGKIVTQEEWLTARKKLLEEEKAHLRAADALAAKRRELPMVKIDKEYTFTDASGNTVSLLDLFGDKRQLIVYHLMFEPGADAGCNGCSFVGDHLPDLRHLGTKDTRLVAISRAPNPKLEAFRAKQQWDFPWYSAGEGDFNYDFGATVDPSRGPVQNNYRSIEELKAEGKHYTENGDLPGLSVFLRQDGQIYHTYSTYQRGCEFLLTTLKILDVTPLGRQDGPWGPGSYKLSSEYAEAD